MNKLWSVILIIFFCLTFGVISYGSINIVEDTYFVIASSDKESFSLDGHWQFYWNQLLTPEDINKYQIESNYLEVPKPWNNQMINAERLPSVGYGTYHIKLKIPKEDIGMNKALSFYYVGSAYRLWINGKEYPGVGVVGTSKQEEMLQLQRNLVSFEPESEVVEIVVQVSNFSFRKGGILSEVIYGDWDVLFRSILIETCLTLFIIGGSLLFGVYHIIIYFIRKNELALLFIGFLAIAVAIRAFVLTEFVVSSFFSTLNWSLLIKVEYLIEIVGFILVVLLYKQLFPKEVSRFLVRLSYLIAVCLSIIIVFTSTDVFTNLLPYHMIAMVSILLYLTIYVSTMSAVRKREGAKIQLIAMSIVLLAVINDGLVAVMLLESIYLIEYAFILFILLQAVIVSNRYARLFQQNNTLAEQLLDLNHSLEEKVNQRTKKLNEKNRELEDMQRTRTKLLANIAHDIGTPIVGVQTYLQIVKEGKIKVDIHQILPQIMEKLSYIQRLNNDLLELSKLESRQLPFHLEKVTVKKFMNDTFQIIQLDLIQNAACHLGRTESNVNGEEAILNIDKTRIMQVIQNYVTNAIKFNDSSEKVIILHWFIQRRNQQEEKTYELVVEVVDNGIGISVEELDYIFERFYKKFEGNLEGSGLGLAIVKEIIEQHGGAVGARSKQGKGSIFYFTLPVDLK